MINLFGCATDRSTPEHTAHRFIQALYAGDIAEAKAVSHRNCNPLIYEMAKTEQDPIDDLQTFRKELLGDSGVRIYFDVPRHRRWSMTDTSWIDVIRHDSLGWVCHCLKPRIHYQYNEIMDFGSIVDTNRYE